MAKKQFNFNRRMLNGHPGNVTVPVRRIIVRAVNSGLIVTSTTDGGHSPTSYHKPRPPMFPRGRAVDLGHKRPGTREATQDLSDFQRNLITIYGAWSFHEIYGPNNEWNVKNGIKVGLGESTPLETLHDTHDHVAPKRAIPLPRRTRAQIQKRKLARRRRFNEKIARRHGAKFVDIIFDAAHKIDISVALALALVEKESNFDNVYGHDALPGKAPIWHGEHGRVPVTEGNVRAYLKWARNHSLRQGVGPVQLTSAGFQEEAQSRGGLHKPEITIPYGLDILKSMIKDMGSVRKGCGAFNGGRGNPNLVYADDLLKIRDKWARRLK